MWVIRNKIELPEPGVMICVSEDFYKNKQKLKQTVAVKAHDFNDPLIKQAYGVYAKAHNNAVNLIQDAKLLLQNSRYARAFAVAYAAFEEIGKSQFAADVYSGFIPKEQFEKMLKNHHFKGAYTKRTVLLHSSHDLSLNLDDQAAAFMFELRNDALYASATHEVKNEDFKQDAKTLTTYCEQWIELIVVSEQLSERIGTKALLK